jgi:hypothetical protein
MNKLKEEALDRMIENSETDSGHFPQMNNKQLLREIELYLMDGIKTLPSGLAKIAAKGYLAKWLNEMKKRLDL